MLPEEAEEPRGSQEASHCTVTMRRRLAVYIEGAFAHDVEVKVVVRGGSLLIYIYMLVLLDDPCIPRQVRGQVRRWG